MSTKTALEGMTSTGALKTKLRTEAVSMSFDRDGQRMSVLENIDLQVGDGEFVCILGPSGCGKSTLLSAMAGGSGSAPTAKGLAWIGPERRAQAISGNTRLN